MRIKADQAFLDTKTYKHMFDRMKKETIVLESRAKELARALETKNNSIAFKADKERKINE